MEINQRLIFRRRTVIATFLILLIYGCLSFVYIEFNVEKNRSFLLKIGNYKLTINKEISTEQDNFFINDRLGETSLRGYVVLKEEVGSSICPRLSIAKKHQVENVSLRCAEHKPSESGCKFAAEKYIYDIQTRTCKTDTRLRICYFKKGILKCSFKKCGRNFSGEILIHMFDRISGKVRTLKAGLKEEKSLISAVRKYGRKTVRLGYHFLFLSCGNEEKLTQLLLLDKSILRTKKKLVNKDYSSGRLNINVVMIDSISRPHFYRSLKRTISTFNEINTDPKNDSEVLDFEQFQALHGHSAENSHAFFSGDVFPKNFTQLMKEEQPVGIKEFYTYLKEHGYDTIYQDDMCYEAVWGIRMDLASADDWDDLKTKIREANIDDTG